MAQHVFSRMTRRVANEARGDARTITLRLRHCASAMAVAALVGCAPPLVLDVAPPGAGNGVQPRGESRAARAEGAEQPTIEVRYFRWSPTVSIVGWDADETEYGLRAVVRRDGTLVRDHRLYVSTYIVYGTREFSRAMTPTRPLLLTGLSRDPRPCQGGPICTPPETFGAWLPDALLRANRDSVTVRFYGRSGRELVITLRRELIDAYLHAVDSVIAELRQR